MTLQMIANQETSWINIVQPTDKDLASLRQTYPFLTPLNIEDIVSIIERPKIDWQDDYLFVILQLPRWDPKERLTRSYEVDVFIGKGFVVTAHDGDFKPLDKLFERAQTDMAFQEAMLAKGSGHTFYVIIDALIDYLFPILGKIDYNIRTLEERIFAADGRAIIREIAILRRDIIAMQRIIRQLIPVIDKLDPYMERIYKDDLTDYFDDIVDHIHRARDIIDEDADVVESLADTADKLLTHRLNNVIRVLTVISVIMLPLTLISSVYGMNLAVLPLAEHPDSFWIISGIMIAVALAMLLYFRLRGWV